MPALAPSTSQLARSLARVCDRHRVARKLVVAPTLSIGRELLRRTALAGSGWIGCEVVTPRPLALRLARPAMERTDAALIDSFETRALMDEAMDAALGDEASAFARLADGVGFRERAHGAVEALRLAGIGSNELTRAKLADRPKRAFLSRMLLRYEQTLASRRRMDTADLLRLALAAMEDAGATFPPALEADVVVLVPGLGLRGLTGRLVGGLVSRGAKVLESEPVYGLETPPRFLWKPSKEAAPGSRLRAPDDVPAGEEVPRVELFRAASVHEELREVLRRAADRSLRWDEIEIVTPDPEAYGSALHALCTRLGIPVTFAVGLPVARTRVGRVVRAYLDWIAEGFQADPIRRLLEAGDLRAPRSRGQHGAAALSRRFRALRVGWGRNRYKEQLREALANVERIEARRYETEEALRRRHARTRSELEALRSILFPALRATPSVPDHMGQAGARVSPAELARGLRAFLRRVPRGRGVDRAARDDVDRVLERVEATLTRRTSFLAAVAALRRHLDLRVRGEAISAGGAVEAGAPWSSEGGHLHLTDLEHGGYTGRKAVFLVGWDADRVGGLGGQDPMLLDADRRVLGDELPTSLDLLREREFGVAALFARLGGSVTMSYCAWDAGSARAAAPSPVMLQALRLSKRDATLSFRDLDAASGRVVCAAPAAMGVPLDGDDAWMSAIHGTGPGRAVGLVTSAFPMLARGLEAQIARRGPPGPLHGVVGARPQLHDPRHNAAVVVSASRLQDLGRCPLSYLHGSILEIRAPDDPELDPDRWLDALRSGDLLHRVYDTSLREASNRGILAADDAFESLTLDALARAIERMRAEVPVPGEGALLRQTQALRSDVRSFVRMVRRRGAAWVALELKFGLAGEEPAIIEVPGGAVRLRGAVDRIDEDLNGLTVIDYKTGAPWDFAGTGTFNGGRRLQHALYALVAESRLRSRVVSGEFHFPTMRGQNEVMTFDRMLLAGVHDLLGIMLDGVAAGAFVPTDTADDCKFCDFGEICRARVTGPGKVVSPLAAWSAEHTHAALWPAFAHLKRARTFER
ncbi:MAG: PD-(D/E)XK nuclease family protein [Gemmatimonadales bacterium]